MSLSWLGGDSLFTGPCEREVSKRVSCGYTPTGGRDDKRIFYEQLLIVKFFCSGGLIRGDLLHGDHDARFARLFPHIFDL
jgi:hypothetical protein